MARFDYKKFIKDVLNAQYALVVGNEIILDEKLEPTRDVHQYFLRIINEKQSVQYENYHEIALDKGERINPIRRLVVDGDIQFQPESVSLDLRNMLKTRLFTTVLTTTTDGYLEAAMKEIWGEELRVVNIYDKETVDGLQKAISSCRRDKRYTQPTLIYVFGKMDINDMSKRYVKTDADAIELIAKWMRMDIEANNVMLDFIRCKRLLALGCKYDNWYFRFFWYVLTGISKSCEENNYDGRGEVAFHINEDGEIESKLLQFLERTDIFIHKNAQSFITDIANNLTDNSQNAILYDIIKDNRNNSLKKDKSIFISYCSKDVLNAIQLFFKLCDKYNVWFDNTSLYAGVDYQKEIESAISASKIIITILSPNVANDLENNILNNYYNKEWRMAQQFDDKLIIPLAINGYNLRASYHTQKYEMIINKKSNGIDYTGDAVEIDLMDSDGFSKLISSIEKHFNNA